MQDQPSAHMHAAWQAAVSKGLEELVCAVKQHVAGASRGKPAAPASHGGSGKVLAGGDGQWAVTVVQRLKGLLLESDRCASYLLAASAQCINLLVACAAAMYP